MYVCTSLKILSGNMYEEILKKKMLIKFLGDVRKGPETFEKLHPSISHSRSSGISEELGMGPVPCSPTEGISCSHPPPPLNPPGV
jgi:hypothetical protein